jgi:poly(A) polymerase
MSKRKLFNYLKQVSKKYETKIYLVGGPLRDEFLGIKTKDWDILVEKNIRAIGKNLANFLNTKFLFYKDFYTGTIPLNNHHIDIAQTRGEIYPKPAVLPLVFTADLISDLSRRDFTINAMAKDLVTGELIDPFCGLSDLKKGLVRALHPKSFFDDPTRIFRAIRFAERFGFKIEPKTLNWLRIAIKKRLPSLLSGERVLNELRLITKEERSERMIRRLSDEGLFYSLFGKRLNKTFFQQFRRVAESGDANLKLIHLLAQFKLPTKFPITKQEANAIRDYQRFPKFRRVMNKVGKPSEIYQALRGFSAEALQILKLVEKPSVAAKINDYLEKYQTIKIHLGGDDIKALGIKPGAIYGKLLDNILFAKLDGAVKTRADEIRLLKEMVKNPRG